MRILRRIREAWKDKETTEYKFTQKNLSIQSVAFEQEDESEPGWTKFEEMVISNEGQVLSVWPDTFFDQEFTERFS